MPEPVRGYLSYRVLDPNNGSELIPDLPHLNQSSWKVRALQRGVPGSGNLSTFSIPLFPAASAEGRRYKQVYDLLDKGQRIEAYWVTAKGTTPYQTGVITKIDRPVDGPWIVSGTDSLWTLQQTKLAPLEQFGGNSPPSTADATSLVKIGVNAKEVVFDDWCYNFPNHLDSWNTWVADPYLGLPAAAASAGFGVGGSLNSTWSRNQQFNWNPNGAIAVASQITLTGTMIMGTDTANAGSMSLYWLSDATLQNGFLANIVGRQTGASTNRWAIDVRVYTISGGTLFQQSLASNVFTGLYSTVFPFQLMATLFTQNGFTGPGFQAWVSLSLNGKDCNAPAGFTAVGNLSGNLGFRGTSQGTNGAIFFNRVRFEARPDGVQWGTSLFQYDTLPTVTAFMPLVQSRGQQTNLDLLNLCMALTGMDLKKTPGRGWKSDRLTLGTAPGTDRTAQIRLEEGVNVLAEGTQLTSLSELYSTVTRYSGVPGIDSGGGGSVEWSPLGNVGDRVVEDAASDVAAPTQSIQIRNAIQVVNRKSNPLTALQVNVERMPDLAEKFDLLDSVTVHLPTARIYNQTAKVMGWDFTEGEGSMIVYLNQFPETYMVASSWDKLVRTLEWIAEGQKS